VEVFVAVEWLADQRGADDVTVALDQAALRLIGENDSSDSGYRQRIGKARDQCEGDQNDDCRADFA
jgi:hypothetical protein